MSDRRYGIFLSNVEPVAAHACEVLLNEFVALLVSVACAVLQEAFVARGFRFWAGATSSIQTIRA